MKNRHCKAGQKHTRLLPRPSTPDCPVFGGGRGRMMKKGVSQSSFTPVDFSSQMRGNERDDSARELCRKLSRTAVFHAITHGCCPRWFAFAGACAANGERPVSEWQPVGLGCRCCPAAGSAVGCGTGAGVASGEAGFDSAGIIRWNGGGTRIRRSVSA